MIIETKRVTFDPLAFPLEDLAAKETELGKSLDFDAKNQMRETNEVLEVYVQEAATAGNDVTDAVAKEVTLEVTTAPTSAGNVTVAGVEIALDPTTETDAEATALAIASADFSGAGWAAVQGTDADVAKVFFTAVVAGVKEDLVFADPDTATGTEATATTTEEGVDETVTPHAPTLQIVVTAGDEADDLSIIQSGGIFALGDLVEGKVIYKAALPDNCGQHVQVNIKNASEDVFTGGKIVGLIRPL